MVIVLREVMLLKAVESYNLSSQRESDSKIFTVK